MGQLLECVRECGLEPTITLDPSITRGLDYYTGMVCEAFLDRLPEFGAICGGGRYNDLASLYTREKLPGVGASIGLDRLLSALEELGLGRVSRTAPDLLILLLEEGLLAHCQGLASRLRQEGLAVEVYPESRKLAQQLKYAEKRQIPLSIFYGEEEHAGRRYTLKDLRSRRSYEDLSFESLRDTVRRLLST
jgi:histidyl-tRNA synthetase